LRAALVSDHTAKEMTMIGLIVAAAALSPATPAIQQATPAERAGTLPQAVGSERRGKPRKAKAAPPRTPSDVPPPRDPDGVVPPGAPGTQSTTVPTGTTGPR
jgi:hypothetical protein